MQRADVWRDQGNLAAYLEGKMEDLRALTYETMPLESTGPVVEGDFNYTRETILVKPTPAPSPSTWVAATTGDGLSGTYYDLMDFAATGSIANRNDASLNLNSTNFPPAPIYGTTFSARWKGYIKTTTAGNYPFTITAATGDGVRLWIWPVGQAIPGSANIINQWPIPSGTTASGTATGLTANTYYAIQLEYNHNTGSPVFQLQWTPPGSSQAVVPATNLYTQTGHNKMAIVNVANSDSSIQFTGQMLTFASPPPLAVTVATPTPTPPPANSIYVTSITFTVSESGGSGWWTPTVTIRLAKGDGSTTWSTAPTVTIYYHYEGQAETSYSASAPGGVFVRLLPRVPQKGPDTIYVRVSNVTLTGYNYYGGAYNVITSASLYYVP